MRGIRGRHRRHGDWSDRSLKTRPQGNVAWHLEHLSAHGTKTRGLERKTLNAYYSGEVIALPFTRASRERRIKAGFRFRTAPRQRLPRRHRDTRLRFGRRRRRQHVNLIKR